MKWTMYRGKYDIVLVVEKKCFTADFLNRKSIHPIEI
ncbi:hypothetical protein CLV42_10275 [Chitinophaga ginsengisoli]|uniref:Uncharacterized protein n=1 Tax=Chitinophaga ginsengisoli TaxID=363837 RepID=A0A2P8GKK6_9BACT|nr:hypothetical protein CLV42_10275 [Chitinophaga ginsengisoli]